MVIWWYNLIQFDPYAWLCHHNQQGRWKTQSKTSMYHDGIIPKNILLLMYVSRNVLTRSFSSSLEETYIDVGNSSVRACSKIFINTCMCLMS